MSLRRLSRPTSVARARSSSEACFRARCVVSCSAVCAAALFVLPSDAAGEPPAAEVEVPEPEGARAGDPVTLGTVLQTAVRRSPALELARIDVDIADARALEATGIDDWLVSATAEWRSTRMEPVEGDFVQTTESDVVDIDLGLARELPSGGTFSLIGGSSFSQTTSAIQDPEEGVFETESEAVRASILARLDQPLLGGRGRAAARADVRRAEADLTAAELEMRADASEIVRDIIQAYWELGYARSNLAIRQSSLELARERRRITDAGVEEGAVAPSELLAVDQVIATREEEVEAARLTVTQRALDLRRLAGMPVGPRDIDIVVGAPVAVRERELPLEELLTEAHAHSPEIAALRARGEGAEIDVEFTENGLLPRLDASVSFGPAGASGSVSDTAQQIARLEGYEVGASLTYEHALGRSAARGAHAAARGGLAQATIGIAEAQLQVSAAMVEAVRSAETAYQRMEASARAIEFAEQNIEAEEARFELGRATNFDVLERQDEFMEAELRHARAGVDYLAALAQVETLTGEVLGSYGIDLDVE